MSDDDRAAKAARAKALFNKKRQQKKPGPVATPGSPLIRALSPPLADSSEDVKVDVTEILGSNSPGQDASEPEWLTSLPRVGTPSIVSPHEHSSPVILASSVARSQSPAQPIQSQSDHSLLPESVSRASGEELERLRVDVQNQHRTITLLVSEKMSLSTSLERLSDISARASKLEALLKDGQAAFGRSRERILHLENEAQQRSAKIEELSHREKEFEERCREKERELQLNKSYAEGLKVEVEQSQALIRELQERIQSGDRVDELEVLLRNVQNKASELEFQLSKSKQANVSLKADRDRVETSLKEQIALATSLATKVTDLEGRSAASQKQLASLTAEHQALRVETGSLQSQIDNHLGTIAGLRKAASQSTANQEMLDRQLQSSQAELRNAIRRAEEAERIQQELQNEGSSLMNSLDEMRPKIVELTNAKLELSEKLNVSKQGIRDRDGVIVQLETSLQAAQDQNESLLTKLLDAETAHEKDRSTAQETQDELQRGYAELETALSDALASIRGLEVERAGQRQLTSKQVEELDRMAATSQTLKEEIASLHQEVEERNLAEVEQQEFLERARTDIEALRADLVAKVEQIDELHAELSVAAANSTSPSLDKEMMNALKQQHRLELSAAQSQIRALQTGVFEAEARAHSFQRQLSQSEDQLAQLRASSSPSGPPATTSPPVPPPPSSSSSHAAQRPFSPSDHPSRPSSRGRNHSDDLRRKSLTKRRGSNNNGIPLGAAHPAFGVALSPETRHKRKVSLGMLKARIDSEMAAAGSIPPSRAASPLQAVGAENASSRLQPHASNSIQNSHKRPQFLDESHIFWCHSCRGELVVL